MHSLIRRILEEPVAAQGVIQTFIPVLVVFGVVQLNETQLGALYAFTAAFLAFITRMHVTPKKGSQSLKSQRK